MEVIIMKRLFPIGLLLLLGIACSSSDDKSNNSCADVCADGCANVASANCPNEDDQATCTSSCSSSCNKILNELPECEEPLFSLYRCASTLTFTCNAEGKADAEGCDRELSSALKCSYCRTVPTRGDCENCLAEKCCDELVAFIQYEECMAECSGLSCDEDCSAKYPRATAYVQCAETNCSVCESDNAT